MPNEDDLLASGEAPAAPPDDPAELARDIDRTRQRLGDTVAALAAKTNVKAQAKRKARDISGRAKATAQRHPELPAAAIAAAAWAAAVALWRRDSHG